MLFVPLTVYVYSCIVGCTKGYMLIIYVYYYMQLATATISSRLRSIMWLWGALREDKYGRTMQQHWILFWILSFLLNASQELFEIVIHFYWLQKKNKSCATNNTGLKEQYIRHIRLNHRHRQSTEVFECHNKTVTRKTSLQRRRLRLSGKHCLNFVFPLITKTLGPVCLGCEESASSV